MPRATGSVTVKVTAGCLSAPRRSRTSATLASTSASDAGGHLVLHRRQDAAARGLLTFDEGSERVARAWAIRHLDELPALTADLPATVPPAPTAPGWRELGLLALLQLRTTLGGAAG